MPQGATWGGQDSANREEAGLLLLKIKIMILPFYHVRTQLEGANYEPGRGPSPDNVMMLVS